MQHRAYPEVLFNDFIAKWEIVTTIRTPVIAAVAGYALGGGCELAMMCDFIVCADTAKFGQPEINLGVIPGSGGTQRLTRLVGKSKAMDMILTARNMDAAEAERAGLVSRVFPLGELVTEAMRIAEAIAARSPVANYAAKRAVNAAYETTLREGVQTERMLFLPLFGTPDQREGMSAFVEKRQQATTISSRRFSLTWLCQGPRYPTFSAQADLQTSQLSPLHGHHPVNSLLPA